MKWQRLNNILHRDVGYLCFGLTIVYVISGIAVNHTHDWNPNLNVTQTTMQVEPIRESMLVSEEFVKSIPQKLDISDSYLNYFRPAPDILQIFLKNSNLRININTGEVIYEKIQSRYGLREMNDLHLNRPKKLWTYFADLYAVALGVVAVTGLFVLKGKKGITGRGSWLTAIGIIIPVLFILFYL